MMASPGNTSDNLDDGGGGPPRGRPSELRESSAFERIITNGGLSRIVKRVVSDISWAGGFAKHGARAFSYGKLPLEETFSPRRMSTRDSPENNSFKLRVMSFNTWGIPISPLSLKRHEAIGKMLFGDGRNGWDVVAFQEVWHKRERKILRQAASAAGLIHQHYWELGVGLPLYPGTGGTGLLICSRYPILVKSFHRFNVTGKIYRFDHGDYMAAKGVGLARIDTPGGVVDVYNTHILAEYSGKPETKEDTYHSCRVAQAFELAQFIRLVSQNTPLTVLCGDLNLDPDSRGVSLIRHLLRFHLAGGAELGNTFGTPDNCFSHDNKAMRLDYVMWSSASQGQWECTCAKILPVFADLPGGDGFSLDGTDRVALSDHWPVGVSLQRYGDRSQTPRSDEFSKEEAELAKNALSNAIELLQKKLTNSIRDAKRSYSRFLAIFVAIFSLGVAAAFKGPPQSTRRFVLALLFAALLPLVSVIHFLLAAFVTSDEVAGLKEILNQMASAAENIFSAED